MKLQRELDSFMLHVHLGWQQIIGSDVWTMEPQLTLLRLWSILHDV